MRRRAMVVGAVAVAIGGAALAFGGQRAASQASGPHLIRPGDGGGFGAIVPDTGNGPYSFGSIVVCLDSPGRVTVKRVEMDDASNMTLGAFGLVASHGGTFGFEPSPLPARFNSKATAQQCSTPSFAELAVQVSRQGATSGRVGSFTVVYQAGRGTRTLTIPFEVILCARGDSTFKDCHP